MDTFLSLGATVATAQVAEHFENEPLAVGLTNSSHPVGCAAALAALEVYREENLIERSSEMGKILRAGLVELAESHPSVGDVRGTGLLQVIELVADRQTREPMSPFNKSLSEPMIQLGKSLREHGLSTIMRWNYLFCAPPLIVTEEQIAEGLASLDRALSLVDEFTQENTERSH